MKKIMFFIFSTLLFANFGDNDIHNLTISPKSINIHSKITLNSKEDLFDTFTRYTHKKLIKCSPNINAYFKILNSKKMEIILNEILESSTQYSCKYKSQKFKIYTELFNLYGFNYYENERVLRLEFNDKINIKSIKDNIIIYKKDRLSKTKLSYKLVSHKDNILVLKIEEEVDNSLELSIMSNLETKNGTILGKNITKNLLTKSHKKVSLHKKLQPMIMDDKPIIVANDEGTFSILVFFDDYFYDKPIRDFISIEGIKNFSIKKDIYLSDDIKKQYNLTNEPYAYISISSKEFKPNHKYKLTLKKGLRNYRELKEDKSYTLHSKDRKTNIHFSNEKPYLSNIGEIGISTINIDKATIIVEKITSDNYRYFIDYQNADIEDVDKFTKEIFSKDIKLDNPKNSIQKQKIILKDMFNDIKYGVYKITFHFNSRDYLGKIIEKSVSKTIFVSDLAPSLNLSSSQAFISVVSLSSAKPIENANIILYSDKNIAISKTITDKNGIAIIDKDLLLSKNPKSIIVSKDNDKSFLLLDKSINKITYNKLKQKQERYKAHIYFQSNIIRPASKINALITIKDRDFISAPKIPVKISLDTQGTTIFTNRVYMTDEFGLIDFNYQLSNKDKTGTYRIKVKIGNKIIGKKLISVEAFMPPKIKNSITTKKDSYDIDEIIEANIKSFYLFGQPASNLKGKFRVTAISKDYINSKYKNYTFSNQNLYKKNEELYIDESKDIILDEKGEIKIPFLSKIDQNPPSILKATLGVTIMDDNQPVSKYKDILIYPYKAMVGIKLKADEITPDIPLELSNVLLNPNRDNKIDRKLSLVIKKTYWHYFYVDGNYRWERETKVIHREIINSNTKFIKKISQNGDYTIEVSDRLGRHSASLDFSVIGWGYENISPQKNLKEVKIKFKDKLYKKGDVLKVSITSPILKGRATITLEGKKVLWHKEIDIDKGVAILDVPLNYDLKRGLYLHATIVRKTDTNSAIIPFRAMGYAFIKPNREKHKIAIDLDFTHQIESKSNLKLNIKTDRDCEILVSVVDSGILSITDQKEPNIFDYFNDVPKREILYFDIYDEVMEYLTKGKAISFGAGDDEFNAKLKKHLAPKNDDRIKPYMRWYKISKTTNKELNITIDVPQFNGKANILVVAIDRDSIGVVSEDLIVKDDIMIKPSYPRFILRGDRFTMPIRIFNTTKISQKLTIDSNYTSQLTFKIENSQITIPANSSKLIYANIKAIKEGKSIMNISTSLNGKIFTQKLHLSVLTPYSLSSKIYQNSTTQKEKIKIDYRYLGGNVIVNLSDNILGGLRGDLKYLVTYPYGCVEQTSSKISSIFYAKPFMEKDKLLAKSDYYINEGIKRLSSLQKFSGEFSYWQSGGYVNLYSSLYASETLLMLSDNGYSVSKRVKAYTLKALKKIARGKTLSNGSNNFEKLYAGYILSLYNELDDETLNYLYDKKIYKDYYLSWYYMGAILENMGRDNLAQKIYGGVKDIKLRDLASVKYTPSKFSSQNRDMFFILYMNSKYFNKNRDDFIVAKKYLSSLHSTHEKALAFKALNQYLGKNINKKMNLSIKLNKERLFYTKPIVFTDILNSQNIEIKPLNSSVANYSIEVYKHLPKRVKNYLDLDKDLSIKREFIDNKGKRVDLSSLNQGDNIYSKLTIKSKYNMKNLVIDYKIPACMEIINNNFNKSVNPFKDKNLQLDYRDIRDDKVLYFLSTKKKKDTIIYTPLIVTTIGDFYLPAVTIEAMYDSQIQDYAKEVDRVEVISKYQKTPKIKSKTITKNSIKDFVRRYYRLEESNANPSIFGEFFTYPIKNYFNKRNMNIDKLLDNKVKYNRAWREKKYDILNVKIVREYKSIKKYGVVIEFDYVLKNSKGKVLRGSSRHFLTLKIINNKIKIEKIEIF